jgi:hypothetical protein
MRYLGLAREYYNLVMTCPKCNGEMEVGFVAGPRVVEWIEDPLHEGTLLGVKSVKGNNCQSERFVVSIVDFLRVMPNSA